MFLKTPSIWLPFLDNSVCFFGNGMVTALMQPHLAEAGASTTEVGISYLIFGACFAVATPTAGFVRSTWQARYLQVKVWFSDLRQGRLPFHGFRRGQRDHDHFVRLHRSLALCAHRADPSSVAWHHGPFGVRLRPRHGLDFQPGSVGDR